MSVHPSLLAQFPAKVQCLLECVAALEKCNSNSGSMRTELQEIEVRLISNLPNCRGTTCKLSSRFSTNERSYTASDRNHAHLHVIRLPLSHSEVLAGYLAALALDWYPCLNKTEINSSSGCYLSYEDRVGTLPGRSFASTFVHVTAILTP
jgi:hypothetical protein